MGLIFYFIIKKNLLLIFTKIKFIQNFIIQLKPNWDLIKVYLFKNYRYSYATSETFFKDVFLFKINSINLFKKEKTNISKLFSFKVKETVIKNINDAKFFFLKLLNRSFKKRNIDLINNKAFLLSGGLDSPTIAAIGSKNIKSKIKTYSIGYKKSHGIKKNSIIFLKNIFQKERIT